MTSRKTIDDFLGGKRLAMVGVSRSPKHFTRTLLREFTKRGYDVVPVNPNLPEVEGRRCYGCVQDIEPPVEGVLIATKAERTEQVVRDCAEAGIRRVWMYRAAGTGAVSSAAEDFCAERGIAVASGCPLMFFPRAGFPHNVHGWISRLTGSYPK